MEIGQKTSVNYCEIMVEIIVEYFWMVNHMSRYIHT